MPLGEIDYAHHVHKKDNEILPPNRTAALALLEKFRV